MDIESFRNMSPDDFRDAFMKLKEMTTADRIEKMACTLIFQLGIATLKANPNALEDKALPRDLVKDLASFARGSGVPLDDILEFTSWYQGNLVRAIKHKMEQHSD